MKTVLIIAYECRPFNRPGSTIGAQRPYQFAKWLPQYGWRAIVLCSDFSKRRTIAPSADLKPRVRAIVKQYWENKNLGESTIIGLPTPQYATIADKLWFNNVETLANGTYRPSVAGNNLKRKISSAAKLFSGDYSEDMVEVGKLAIEYVVENIGIDCVVGEHSPDVGIRLPSWASKKYGLKWLADFRDPVFQPFKGISYFISKLRIKLLLSSCSATINVNEYWSEIDKSIFKKPAYTISNGFDEEEFYSPQKTASNKTLQIFFAGNITLQSDVSPLFKCLKLFSKERSDSFKFIYRGDMYKYFIEKSKEFEISHFTDIQPKVNREALLQDFAVADILILFGYYNRKPNFYLKNGYVPGKTFEYFGLNKPILCIGLKDDMLGRLIKETNTGVVSLEPKEIASFLKQKCLEKVSGKEVTHDPIIEKIFQFSRRKLTQELSNILNTYTTPR